VPRTYGAALRNSLRYTVNRKDVRHNIISYSPLQTVEILLRSYGTVRQDKSGPRSIEDVNMQESCLDGIQAGT